MIENLLSRNEKTQTKNLEKILPIELKKMFYKTISFQKLVGKS